RADRRAAGLLPPPPGGRARPGAALRSRACSGGRASRGGRRPLGCSSRASGYSRPAEASNGRTGDRLPKRRGPRGVIPPAPRVSKVGEGVTIPPLGSRRLIMICSRRLGPALGLLFALPVVALADDVYLKNGKSFQDVIATEEGAQVRIRMPAGE